MTKPVRRLQHRWSIAERRVCQPNTVWCLAIAYLLLEVRGGEEPGARRGRGIETDRVNLHRLDDVLEILPTEFAIGHVKLALDLIGDNIRVNSLCPGITQTPLLEQELEISEDQEATRQEFATWAPIGRPSDPREQALGVLFLASREASFAVGATLLLDGGYTAR